MSKSINKSEFINRLNGRCDNVFDADTTESSVNELLSIMKQSLAKNERIEVRGFGSFSLNHRKPRIARNPKTGQQVKVGAKAIPHFKPGKALRENVNDSALMD